MGGKKVYWGVFQDDLQPMNSAFFMKMAHGDTQSLKALAEDFFADMRKQMSGWLDLIEAGDFTSVRDDLHRCKGGASLFGLERLVAIIGATEAPKALESMGFDLSLFEAELSAAENAVIAWAEPA